MVWLSIPLNLSTSRGNDSLNRLICEIIRVPNATMTKKVRNIVIRIATTLFIFIRTKKFTTGCSTMAIIIAKMRGTIIPLAKYNIVNKAHKPMNKMDAFAYNGNFNFSFVTPFQYSILFYGKHVETETG